MTRVPVWQSFTQRRSAPLALCLLGLIVLAVLFGPLFSPYAVDFIDFEGDWSSPPTLKGAHWFGTDSLGRDLFVRTLEGGRISLLVGVLSTLVAAGIGVAYGAAAGYYGGRTDQLMMRAVDVLYALPFMFLVILLMALFGRHLVLMFVAIGAVNWLDMARIVRGQTLALKQREFVIAARLSGAPDAQIVRRHIVPNLLGVAVVYASLTIPQVVLIESFLSFLGLGVQAPATSWGALVNDGAREMESTPWSLVFPAGFLTLTLLCLNAVGEGLRQALERRSV
ncbi:ABC transporter permease subunit [Sinimarinibacterium sp. CAU 1509]|uniref:ABC transporter permease subunit n=1 Tax=Sinimarinibacterium sp. CAU 1509 TaxID=2562283 RepID=UPI0010AD7DD3|nr:ABC transporter permease subunit [Sinimarinibacterium sp. CAU 1509]TJY56777.1 ABC transporter permease subunit [Sinimarinibacterium sp. CAU 1509]